MQEKSSRPAGRTQAGEGLLAEDGCWDGQLPGHPSGHAGPQPPWGAGRGAGWGTDRTQGLCVPLSFPLLSPYSFFDLGFLAQIGFLFGLNSIPHPAY